MTTSDFFFLFAYIVAALGINWGLTSVVNRSLGLDGTKDLPMVIKATIIFASITAPTLILTVVSAILRMITSAIS